MARRIHPFAAAIAALLFAAAARAQQTPPPANADPPPVGAMAPDFAIAGATRYGLLKNPARLSDYRGETVVIAFFFRARTRG